MERFERPKIVLIGGRPDRLHSHPEGPDEVVGQAGIEAGIPIKLLQVFVGMAEKHLCITPSLIQ
jgi:hypothetical protein